MEERIRLITDLVIARVTKEFALKVGVGEEFADILSQVHVKSSNILRHWMAFLEANCAGCAHQPDSCLFFHPTEESCKNSATPQNTRRANFAVVENGIMRKCPVFERARSRSV